MALGCTICGGGRELDVYDASGRRSLTVAEVVAAVREGLNASTLLITLPARCDCGAKLVLVVDARPGPPTPADEEAELDDELGVEHWFGPSATCTMRLVPAS